MIKWKIKYDNLRDKMYNSKMKIYLISLYN